MKNYNLYPHKPIFTIKELLQLCVTDYNEKIAFAYQNRKQKITVSYKNFSSDVNAFGTYLYSQGFKSCKISIFGENSYEWILSHFAITCGKNISVPIDKELDADSVLTLLKDSDSKLLIYSDTYADIIEAIQSQGCSDIVFYNMKDIPNMIAEGKQQIENGDTEYIDVTISKDDLASIVYTSGTTGKSKGVMLTHYNLMSDLYGASCYASIFGTSILLLPLHHTFGLVAGLYSVMYYGYTLYINQSFKRLLSDFQTAKPQNTFAVPLIVETLYKNIWIKAREQGKEKALKNLIKISDFLRLLKIDLRKVFFKSVINAFGGNLNLIICGGAPLNEELVKALDSIGITVLNGYGITECAPIVAVNRNKFNVVGSVGFPLCCNTVKIADDGEILVKGDNVMQGYYNNPTENEKVFYDGWFRTGDIGFLDKHGALHITGRIKNLIILGNGENIPAETIEEHIYTIPYVKEAIAYGKDNVIVAEVYLDEDITTAKQTIEADIQKINEKMPLNYNIGKVVVRDTKFPKTTTKKIKRNHGENNNA